ncbi:hypothetical protein AJ80_08809 [Polytolypa hystricis UAMH7299]|uniref:HORMA domain-containing protein n=1 Tax=Polytolypa hystricis (strain UAMH7299) TaxID=1447883 RepID=A0A2B7X1T7_POLH7|nr:hypothetical protein AJ80_08809 [Polytolypa hystricis UAMH7299]
MARVIYTEPRQVRAGAAAAAPRMAEQPAPASVQKEKQGQEQTMQKTNTVQHLLHGEQSQAMKQQQSLALVQIMLHASFGTLFYLRYPSTFPFSAYVITYHLTHREFLPLSCFGERELFQIAGPNAAVSYEDFIEGKSSTAATTANASTGRTNLARRGQPLKIIVRNRDEKADNLLDLLEHGVFEAIEKNVLEAIQLTVFVDKDSPAHILESYTFTFEYTGKAGDVNNQLASVSLGSTGYTADMKTTRSAKLGLEMIIRRLITLSTFLPMLPNQRYMEIHLFYTADCPPEYEPPGFRTAAHNNIVFPNDSVWSKEHQSCGAMDTGIHKVGLKVTSLKWSDTDRRNEDISNAQIPDEMEYTDVVDRDLDVGFDHADTVPDLVQTSQESSQNFPITDSDVAIKDMLQKMIIPSSPDSDLVPTQIQGDSTASTEMADTATIAVEQRAQLSQLKFDQLRGQKENSATVHSMRGGVDKSRVGAEATPVIRCQCDYNYEEGDMIECNFCKAEQHLFCYGFLSAADPKIPDVHACYKCLLEPDEMSLLHEMDTLVLLRRALKIIIEEGYQNRLKEFANKLHCNGQTVLQVTDMLKKQGYIQATPGSKSRGFMDKGLPKYRIPDNPEVRDRLRKEIFNPLAKIAHHYLVPGQSEPARAPSYYGSPELNPIASDASESSLEYTVSGPRTHERPFKFRGRTRKITDTAGYKRAFDHTQGPRAEDSLSQAGAAHGASRSRDHPSTVADRATESRRQRSTSPNLNTQGSQANGNGDRNIKKRKLSNAVDPIDICEPSDSETE